MPAKSLEQVRNLCMRRGFVFPGSAAYGGVASFWDYGPLGAELLNNVKKAWWQDAVYSRDDMEGLDAAILMSRKVWQHSGHEATFSDPLVDNKVTKKRYRLDHLLEAQGPLQLKSLMMDLPDASLDAILNTLQTQADFSEEADEVSLWLTRHLLREANQGQEKSGLKSWGTDVLMQFRNLLATNALSEKSRRVLYNELTSVLLDSANSASILQRAEIVDPSVSERGEWTTPRRFNLMFQSHVGPVSAAPGTDDEKSARVYLRPETAQGIFMNFAHVQRAMARKIPFGIAQMGKAFRNEITPGNFIFRTREFEQMEIEFFIKPPRFIQPGEKSDEQWHAEWIDQRFRWWLRYATPPAAGNAEMEAIEERFRKRAQTADELAHYAKATTDIEYLFPGALGWGEIEGVANRTDFDLTAHSKDVPEADLKRLKLEPNTDSTEKFDYFDPDAKQRYIPWVIEPSAGVTRAALTFMCEAYDDEIVKEPDKQQIDQFKSDAAAIRKNAEKKIKDAEKDIAANRPAKHDPANVAAFLDALDEVVSRLPDSLSEVLTTLEHAGAQNLEPVKKFRPAIEATVEECMRTVLRLHPALAPVKLAVFPLKKNKPELVALAQKIKGMFQKQFRVMYDDSAGIGRLYRRQDEIGTPFCITVDFESLEDGTVTVRERDTMGQERVKVEDLPEYLNSRMQ